MAAGKNQTQQSLGSVGLAGASIAVTANAVRNQLDRTQLAALVPEAHLLSSNFVIPPGMHAKKWIALYTAKPFEIPYMTSVTLEITNSEGKIERIVLPFRVSGISPSEWQKDHPDHNSNRWNAFLDKSMREAQAKKIVLTESDVRAKYIVELMKFY